MPRTASVPWTDTYLLQGPFLCKNTFFKLVCRLEAALCVSLLKKKQHFKKDKNFPVNITRVISNDGRTHTRNSP